MKTANVLTLLIIKNSEGLYLSCDWNTKKEIWVGDKWSASSWRLKERADAERTARVKGSTVEEIEMPLD